MQPRLKQFMASNLFTLGWQDQSTAIHREICVEQVEAERILAPGYSEALNSRAAFLDIQTLVAFLEKPESIPFKWRLFGKRILFQGTRLNRQGIPDQVPFLEFDGNSWKIGYGDYDGQWSIGAYSAILPRT